MASLVVLLVFFAAGAFIFWPGFGSYERWFAPKAIAWQRWEQHNPGSKVIVDHSALTSFLQKYVRPEADGLNTVNYDVVTPEDVRMLATYIKQTAALPVSKFNRDVQLAFWINLYNAITIDLILSHYPVASIRDVKLSNQPFSIGPWDEKLVTVQGQALSLNDIEHRILRPIWRDPRLHYTVNCASIGCPNLAQVAYTAASLEENLDQAAKAYINSDRGVTITDGRVSVSKIYDWFISDFGGSANAVLAHLAIYADSELAATLAGVNKLHGQHYDWRLNGPRP